MSIQAGEFITTLVRGAIFFPSAQLRGHHVYVQLSPRWYELFDDDPTLIPQNDQLPVSVPLLSLQDQKNEWRCVVTRDRVDIFYDPRLPNAIIDLNKAFQELADYLVEFRTLFNLKVGRLAAICHRYREGSEPGKELANHFCKGEFLATALNRPKQFELNSHKKYVMDGYSVNSWMKNRVAEKINTTEPVILVEQDINTLAEDLEKKEFTDDAIIKYFSRCSVECDEILGKYYPPIQ